MATEPQQTQPAAVLIPNHGKARGYKSFSLYIQTAAQMIQIARFIHSVAQLETLLSSQAKVERHPTSSFKLETNEIREMLRHDMLSSEMKKKTFKMLIGLLMSRFTVPLQQRERD